MLAYVLKRLLLLVPTLFGVLSLTFVVTQFVPGGPVDHALHRIDPSPQRRGMRHRSRKVRPPVDATTQEIRLVRIKVVSRLSVTIAIQSKLPSG